MTSDTSAGGADYQAAVMEVLVRGVSGDADPRELIAEKQEVLPDRCVETDTEQPDGDGDA